jgi:hypothetical protein
MGYTGISGRSAKVLSDLAHFGLLEKAGSGSVRVTRRAVEILYPASEDAYVEALHEAAGSPSLFAELNAQFSDGLPSENALRSYLMRNSFASTAIGPVIKSYMETYRDLEQRTFGRGRADRQEKLEETSLSKIDTASTVRETPGSAVSVLSVSGPRSQSVALTDGERVVFVEEADAGRYLKVIASGVLDDNLLEALEDFTKRQRKRLSALQSQG